MITTDRMDRLVIDLTLGNEVKAETAEETEFIRKIHLEIRQARRDNQIVEIPAEWQV